MIEVIIVLAFLALAASGWAMFERSARRSAELQLKFAQELEKSRNAAKQRIIAAMESVKQESGDDGLDVMRERFDGDVPGSG